MDGKIDFSGIIAATLKLDTKTIMLDSSNFVYTSARPAEVSADIGYKYPYPKEEFYIRIPMSDVGDATEVKELKFKIQKFIEGKGQISDLTGAFAKYTWSAKAEKTYCNGGTKGECGKTNEHGAHEYIKYTYRWYKNSKGEWTSKVIKKEVMYCHGTQPCEHGFFTKHQKGWKEWLELTNTGLSGTQAQDLVKVTADAAIYKTYRSAKTPELNLPLRMNYGGTVWEDEETGKTGQKDGIISYNNGIRTEKGIKNVKVTIYDHETNQACGTMYTDEKGNYLFEKLKMGKYYVVFEYDGQTWEPVPYFEGGEEKFEVNSKAQENKSQRVEFNNKFYETIYEGALSNTNANNIFNIKYDTSTHGKSFAITNDDGKVEGDYYSFFKMTATTMDNNNNIISYPRENEVHIEDTNKEILGTTYVALYPNIEHINLGLEKRADADFEVRKDVYKVIIQINGKTEEYTYSSRDNITESFDIEVKNGPDYENIEYNRAIYRSDYNYRISDYAKGAELNKQGKKERSGENAVDDMINAITNAKGTNSELKVYVIYKMTIANRSNKYSGTINELVDYYDKDYTYTGESWYGTPTTTNQTIQWSSNPKYGQAKNFEGYNTLYTQSTGDLMLSSGQMMHIYMKFEVNKHTDESGKSDSIILDENVLTGEKLPGKKNALEITNYSTFKSGTTIEQKNVAEQVEGKIEKDSRPGNAEPDNKNTYEDDTDAAPVMNIILHKSVERSIFGYVWEDNRTNTLSTGQIIGNGYKDDGEKLINGAVVQLIEKVEIDGKTYEYIWREMESGEEFVKYLDYNGNVSSDTVSNLGAGDQSAYAEKGKYFFNRYVPGNYIVRFIYGDNNSTIQTSANGGKNDISYNGQDYKSTIYKAVETNGFYDLGINEANVSKAKDNALRRLAVNKYSHVMNNHIGNVLASPYKTPEDANLIKELRDNTWMYADTAHINIEVAYNTAYTDKLEESQNTAPVYRVENIGFGVEERPRTNLVLTKQIEDVTVILSNGTVLLDTVNGVRGNLSTRLNKYLYKGNDIEKAKTVIPGQWKYEIDDELLQGAQLKIYYRLTVENNGQVDTVGQNYSLENIEALSITDAESMLGGTYYYGTEENIKLVTSTINKIIDYIDKNIAFDQETESNNGVWYNVENFEELKTVGLIDNSIKITDKTFNNKVTMTKTESLPNNYLDPVNNPKTSTKLVVTKVLGVDSKDYTYGNIAEIIEITNTVGRRDPDQIPGNQDPNIVDNNYGGISEKTIENDTDISEEFEFIPPTGKAQLIFITTIAIVTGAIFGVGIILIKKFAISKK